MHAAVDPSRRRPIANRRAVISAAVARFLYDLCGRVSEYVSGRLPPACCPLWSQCCHRPTGRRAVIVGGKRDEGGFTWVYPISAAEIVCQLSDHYLTITRRLVTLMSRLRVRS